MKCAYWVADCKTPDVTEITPRSLLVNMSRGSITGCHLRCLKRSIPPKSQRLVVNAVPNFMPATKPDELREIAITRPESLAHSVI